MEFRLRRKREIEQHVADDRFGLQGGPHPITQMAGQHVHRITPSHRSTRIWRKMIGIARRRAVVSLEMRSAVLAIECVQHRLRHPVLRWMGATLDGVVAGSGAGFEANSCCRGRFPRRRRALRRK
jgi:hypothetical protein